MSLELPLHKKDIDKLQKVKWNATKMVRRWSTKYKGRLKELGLFSMGKEAILLLATVQYI